MQRNKLRTNFSRLFWPLISVNLNNFYRKMGKKSRRKRSSDLRASVYLHVTQLFVQLKTPHQLIRSKLTVRIDTKSLFKKICGFEKFDSRKTTDCFCETTNYAKVVLSARRIKCSASKTNYLIPTFKKKAIC